MKFIAKKFDELTLCELYEILKSRAEVFVLEQNIICRDMDGVDYISRHIFLEKDGRVAAYMRAFYNENEPDTIWLGRVLSLKHGQGFGTELMREALII